MEPGDVLDNFERFVLILKTGGPYAVSALFFLLWYRSDRRYEKTMQDLKDIAVAKIENDVKTERTLEAGNKAMTGVRDELDTLDGKVIQLGHVLEKILLLKSKHLPKEDKPNGSDE